MTKKIKQLSVPSNCPMCGGAIEVTQIKCAECGSEINGSFEQGGLAILPIEYQKFITVFIRQRGNISGVEKELGISYPTINKMLDNINAALGTAANERPLTREEILDSIEKGEMSVKEAAFILKTRKEGDKK